jgi:hypothetical protein
MWRCSRCRPAQSNGAGDRAAELVQQRKQVARVDVALGGHLLAVVALRNVAAEEVRYRIDGRRPGSVANASDSRMAPPLE